MNQTTQKLSSWLSNQSSNQFIFNNISIDDWLVQNLSKQNNIITHEKITFIVFESSFKASESFNNFKNDKSILLVGPETSPYEAHLHSESKINAFINALVSNHGNTVYTDYQTICLLIPKIEELSSLGLKLSEEMEISQQKLSKKLTELGFEKKEISNTPHSFSIRGEIFDICLNQEQIYRINYFDDFIEKIFKVNTENYKTLRDQTVEKIQISPNYRTFFQDEFVQNLRTQIPKPSPRFKTKNEIRDNIFSDISQATLPENAFYKLPFFFSQRLSLLEQKKESLFIFENFENGLRNLEIFLDNLNETFEMYNDDPDSRIVLPPPSSLFSLQTLKEKQFKHININSLQIGINHNLENTILYDQVDIYQFLKLTKATTPRSTLLQNLFEHLKDSGSRLNKIYLCTKNQKTKFEGILDTYQISKSNVEYINCSIPHSFFNILSNSLYLSSDELFGKGVRKKRKKKSLNFFAEQIATLQKGDYVVHKKHGVGVFCGVQKLNAGNSSNDFIVLEYKDKDKVYVPVYNLELVQKYADANAECTIADLKSKKFDKAKSQARKSVKELAFSVLKLQAEREAFKGQAYSEPGEEYENFAQKFPYTLTDDQASAIEAIIEDMCSVKPMDRLVCGDVGFGKTEVAMRAAFKAVEDGRQVALLVPTTILSLQHFMNFKERFKDFPIQIDYVSRFKTPKATKEIFERVEQGKSDILIGTHKILSSKLNFSNLGLVIIDEEHRFGVAQKEKLKLLKKNTDFLTLTATPIPRTLQLSFLGIKDLSLIQTPPPRRQAISSYMVRENDKTIKNAIDNEIKREGQVFVIHNRVHDIEILVSKIKTLCPDAKITYAHGQMNEKDLEKRIHDFYSGKFNVLIATTIVESGIDIPTANTMIINNSQSFGLAQLHQLRGRIGRSTRKAFCYFLIPDNKKINANASKRLEALQRYGSIGAGFALANSDLEIRGAGDILGAEQSGHIQNIGLELYSQMLKEAIAEIKGETADLLESEIDIKVFFPTHIPDSYMNDQNNRLKYYKLISNTYKNEELDQISEELQDIFGKLPEETSNLIEFIKIRNICINTPIKSLSITQDKMNIKLDEEKLSRNEEVRNKMINTALQRHDLFKVKPNSSLLCHSRQDNSGKSYLNAQSIISLLFDS